MMAMSKKTLIASESGPGIEVIRQSRTALDECGLDQDQLQRVVHRGRELQDGYKSLVMGLAVPQDFTDEEVPSEYGYPSGYRQAKPIPEQMRILREFFPNLGDPDETAAKQGRLANSEGNYVIPRWQLIAPTYGEAVEKILKALKKQRKGKVVNYRIGELGPNRLRESDKKRLAFERLAVEQQGSDVLVVAAQFGFRHRGRSVRRARAIMGSNEFGVGAFEIGIMLLTHRYRLQHVDDLWIDCAGDECSTGAGGGQFGYAPFFLFNAGELKFGARWVSSTCGHYGSASGFLPTEAAA
jgi:hypothetical protein